MVRALAALAALVALLGGATEIFAQVSQVTVRKTARYVQTSPTDIAPSLSGTYSFLASVDGAGISGMAPPTISGPFAAAELGAQHNNGTLVYSTAIGGWRWGTNANEYRATSRSELDRLFPNGTYTFNVGGASVPLNLSGDAYPAPPVLTLNGGSWSNGNYIIDPTKPLTITTNAFSGYGTHLNDVICLFLRGPGYAVPAGAVTSCPLYLQTASAVPSPNFVSVVIPPNTLTASGEYTLVASFNAIVDARSNSALPGSNNNARYLTVTTVSLKAVTPVFPMTVTSSITPTSATATAQIQFRPQDVGTTGSIYAFAIAPASQVSGGTSKSAMIVGYGRSERKDDPPACVLAQMGSNGQLVAASASQLQALTSGILGAQGASVTILNNVSTPTVAGATFYVGYGSSSATMIQNGVYRPAVTVPGSSVCPMLSSQTALWWNPAENGWGVNFAHQGNILFATLFTYDADRKPLWLVMSNGVLQADGVSFTGELYRTTGPAFNADPFIPIGPSNYTQVGTMTASFVDVNSATLRYTVNGAEVNKGIERLVFGTRAASCLPSLSSRANSTNYQDLWWNAAEGGWGVNVTHQGDTLFATLFTYDATGRDLWLVMSGGTRQPDGSYLGTLYRGSGPPFNANPFTPTTAADLATVGTMRFRFADGENGTLTYTVDGVQVTKAITRLVFSSPVPYCN
ncbi:MAG: hypothetical protein FIB05_15250 [Betaproteobacteria bacterium]|nr:hypothetical protein [Betaproteobacteria bacterium]PWB59457.1 MAG: hypothetical protein C3F16_12135 [Betaproteobacteria bacterium]